ncbi:MAG: hypothetical protein ACPKPY_11285 [Nitrososphaeraceae archaeon]
MFKSKIGVFSALMFGVMMLLIPATSIASAQEYDKYYKENDIYGKDYGYGYDNDRPVIIIKNQFSEPHKDKKMKEPPMVLVNKEVLFCDLIANGSNSSCVEEPFTVPGPDSGRYVQDCTDAQCQDINAETFGLKVSGDKEFQGSEDGTKVNLDGKGFVVEENSNLGTSAGEEFACVEAGFDSATFEDIGDGLVVASCVLFEGECSGDIRYGELKECTVTNYVIDIFEPGI